MDLINGQKEKFFVKKVFHKRSSLPSYFEGKKYLCKDQGFYSAQLFYDVNRVNPLCKIFATMFWGILGILPLRNKFFHSKVKNT